MLCLVGIGHEASQLIYPIPLSEYQSLNGIRQRLRARYRPSHTGMGNLANRPGGRQ
jgi:hypothetical protein